jgi:hypothetical protein
MVLIIIITYIIGFVLNVALFATFGKAMGFDYSAPKDYSNCDDWDGNVQAYTAFSLGWPIIDTFLILWGLWTALTKLTGVFVKS